MKGIPGFPPACHPFIFVHQPDFFPKSLRVSVPSLTPRSLNAGAIMIAIEFLPAPAKKIPEILRCKKILNFFGRIHLQSSPKFLPGFFLRKFSSTKFFSQ